MECHVLSIQSTVVFGYVGNKSATFPLQVLGFDVSAINSVQFSNHTGYGKFRGQRLNSEDLTTLLKGLKENNILQFSHLLTGYVGEKSFLEKVGEMVKEMRETNPNLLYVCDPVMGDNGRMYVPDELLPIYRDLIIPLADIVTPNQFEIELLTDKEIHTEDDALGAMDILHSRGVKTVVLSSTNLGSNGKLVSLASTNKNNKKLCYRIDYPELPAVFVGTGDLFAACLLAWMHKDNDLKVALEKTIATLQSVIHRTLDHAKGLAGPRNKPTVEQMELRLIQSKNDIEKPEIKYNCTRLNS